jgi:AAA15 family ATPase/GTPase
MVEITTTTKTQSLTPDSQYLQFLHCSNDHKFKINEHNNDIAGIYQTTCFHKSHVMILCFMSHELS